MNVNEIHLDIRIALTKMTPLVKSLTGLSKTPVGLLGKILAGGVPVIVSIGN
jgi:hypothetical protein